jgi:phage tail-like protein
MPDQAQTTGAYYFRLTVDGHDTAGFFKECTGLSSEPTVVTRTSRDEQGKSLVQKFPGQAQWSNLTLRRGVDSGAELWKWRQEVIDGKIAGARRDGTVEVVDSEGTPLVTYRFLRGWPCKYSAPGLNAGGNDILVEEIEIAHEGFTRQ